MAQNVLSLVVGHDASLIREKWVPTAHGVSSIEGFPCCWIVGDSHMLHADEHEGMMRSAEFSARVR